MNDVRNAILQMLSDLHDDIPGDVSMNLLDGGYIDSFDIANLVPEIEACFHIEIPPEAVIPENFLSVDSMAMMVQKLQKEK
ncbi:acyl carrier protein [Selenomonas sp. F0473]|uniref:acyl carrier protein n=1 Tax=Selenomonas sp. F0473 TaxID=999423 RepID=UPI0025DF7840|nr:phosphopantetheine-binding protein [Selenomonas sp. F0473]